jgi:TRAP-type C4-dicarboxylate transport system permease small subunit
MAGPSLDSKTLRYRDALEPLDAAVFRLEAGLMTFALLAMSATYFLKIVYEAVIAERNFVDAFLIKWLHGVETQPPVELVEAVHGLYSPTVVGAVLLLTGVGAARAIQVQLARDEHGEEAEAPGWSAKTAGMALGIIAGFVALAAIVVNVHSAVLCGVAYVGALAAFGTRAKRRGEVGKFALAWGLLSLPIAVLISRIPGQYAWVNDLSKILIMYVGFIGASMASRDRKHIVLNFGRRLWPSKHKRSVEVLSLLLWLFFDVLLLVLALHLFELQASAGSTLSILSIPEYHIILPVVLSFLLMSVRVAVDLVRVARGTESYFVGSDGTERAPDMLEPAPVEVA